MERKEGGLEEAETNQFVTADRDQALNGRFITPNGRIVVEKIDCELHCR